MRNIQIIADRVNKASNGQLNIQYLGGPEVIPANNQAVAVQQGVIQMSVISMSYYDGIVPVGSMLDLSELTPAEEHTSGAYDFVNEYHKKAGLYYLDRGTAINQSGLQMLILKKSIDKPQQLAGMKIGATSNVIDPFMKTVGGTPVIIQTPDAYSSLEKGVVDGFCYPLTNSSDAQLFEVTKYVVDHPFFRGAVGIIVNLDSWNKLPANLQQMLKDTTAQVLVEYANDLDGQILKARQTATDKGLKFIKFSDTDAQWFMQTMYSGAWADAAKKLPDSIDKMKSLVQKKK
jgi:TRAP-type transport system periplasmic protein